MLVWQLQTRRRLQEVLMLVLLLVPTVPECVFLMTRCER